MSSSADKPFDETLLSAYLDQELAPSERLKVEQELDKSPELRTLFAELSQIRNLVATCNIPLASEPKAISGPWDSSTTTTFVSPTTLDSSPSAWTKNWPRLASLAAAIALLLGLGSIVILSTSNGRWISYRSTNEKVAKRESQPSLTPSAPAPSASAPFPSDPSALLPHASARTSPAERAPEAIAPVAGSMTTDAADVAANAPRSSVESTSESLASRFIQYVNREANKRQLETENGKSLANDQQEQTGVFRVQANAPLDSESGYLLFFDDAKNGKAETLAFQSPSDLLKRQIEENRDKSNPVVIETQGEVGLQSKSQSGVKEQIVELIIPEENWDVASAFLMEKGFAIEDMRSNNVDATSAETLSFRASANPSSLSGWTIVPVNNGSLGKRDAKRSFSAEPPPNADKEASRTPNRRSDLDVVELKDTERKFRRIRVTLSEESTKSRSNE
jgi:hypothetical protein